MNLLRYCRYLLFGVVKQIFFAMHIMLVFIIALLVMCIKWKLLLTIVATLMYYITSHFCTKHLLFHELHMTLLVAVLFLLLGTFHTNKSLSIVIFPFLLCFSLLFFSQLFVRPPQTAILLFCISFSWGWSWSLSPVQCHKPPSIVHQALYQI